MSNIVEYAVNMCKEKMVGLNHLPEYTFEPFPDSLVETEHNQMDQFGQQPSQVQIEQQKSSMVLPEQKRESWSDIERRMIIETLKEHNGSRKLAAAQLEWTRMKLWRKMKKYEEVDDLYAWAAIPGLALMLVSFGLAQTRFRSLP